MVESKTDAGFEMRELDSAKRVIAQDEAALVRLGKKAVLKVS